MEEVSWALHTKESNSVSTMSLHSLCKRLEEVNLKHLLTHHVVRWTKHLDDFGFQ